MEFKIYSKKHGEKTVLIDDEDYELIKDYTWHVRSHRYTFYATCRHRCKDGKYRTVNMHRVIKGLKHKDGNIVDHKNRNGLDNRKENLRVCTNFENARNARKRKDGNTSKYKGVSFRKSHDKFLSRIQVDKKRIHLGYFKNEIEAAKAYNAAALKYHGEYAYLNAV